MPVHLSADANNKKIACAMIDEAAEAISNLKEEFCL
jgi:hypothetical protein